MKTFDNKVAVVTGAASGMGRYLAVLLAKMKCNVAICDVNEEELERTSKMVSAYNVSVSRYRVDVADRTEIETFHQRVITDFRKIDLVFNNAGITVMSEFSDMQEEDWDRVIRVNLDGVINMSRRFLPELRSRPEAALINTSSIFGMVAIPGQSVYHATKFAVRGFTESLSKEMKDTNVQVHCVHPGHVGTNIASAAKYVASEKSASSSLFGKSFSIEEQGKIFKENGMHPSRAAKIILNGVRKKRTRIFVGLDARLLELSQRIFPTNYQKTWPLITGLVIARNQRLKNPLPNLPKEL